MNARKAGVLAISVSSVAMAQPLSGPPTDAQLKFSTPMPPGVASPDKVETRFGTLNFFDGFPDKASAEKLYYPTPFGTPESQPCGVPADASGGSGQTRRRN